MARRPKWEPDSIVPRLIDDTAAELNTVKAEVSKLETQLSEKKRYLRELEDALKALKGTGRVR
jgi:chaperonin cofactor prefoldin